MNVENWWGKNGAQLRCPVPECDHTGDIITIAHCRVEHGMERREIDKLYGPPLSSKSHKRWDIKKG